MAIVDSAVAAGSTLANFGLSKYTAAQNQRYYRENMQANFLLSQQAQKNAARNEVEGLKAAGLSTALADGAAGAPQVTAASGTMETPKFDPANMLLRSQLALADAQRKNVEAQTAKTEADTKSTQIRNARETSYDSVLSQNLAVYFGDLVKSTSDPTLRQFFEDQQKFAASGKANEGNKRAYVDYLDIQGKSEEAVARKLDNKLSAWIAELRWNKAKGHTTESSPFVKALAMLDVRQSDFLAAECANMIASGKNFDAQIQLLNSKKLLTDEQINLTKEQEEQIRTAAESMRDKNIMHWIDKGEYAKAFMVGLLQIFSGFAQKGRGYAVPAGE